jgi:uncharacterized membrane protein YeiH
VHLTATEIVGLLDRIGIIAFAFSGVEIGARRRLDVFGLLTIGIVTATGGGAMRDLLLDRQPFVLVHADYLLWAALASAAAIVLATLGRGIPASVLAIADAAGIGAFASAGAVAAIEAGLPFPAIIVLAVVTATGGGVLRDLLARRVPLVLRAEVQATAAALGAVIVWSIEPRSVNAAALAGAIVAAAARLVSLGLALQLPRPAANAHGDDARLDADD